MVTAIATSAVLWLGPSFAGLPVTYDRDGLVVYGDCRPAPGSDGGCSPPLQVQNTTTCARNPVALDVAPRRIFRVRGGALAASYESGHLELGTGRRAVTIYANRTRLTLRALRALRARSQASAPARRPPPVYPPAVRRELKRVSLARAEHGTVDAIAEATGIPRFAVRVRLRIARLLGPEALRGTPAPRRSWAQVEQDRQAAFRAASFGIRRAARQLAISEAQLRRIVRRVRGLTGTCSVSR